MKQLEVQIMGQSYILGCPEGGDERLRQAVERVDAAMCKIRDAGKVRARDRIAVLAALNLAFDLTDKPPTSAANDAGPVATPPATEPVIEADSAQTLNALLDRLDTALGDDGRLL